MPTDAPIVSELADDPILGPIVLRFLARLPGYVNDMGRATETGEFAVVRDIAHQVKSAAGSVGFDPIMDSAARVEAAASTSDGATLSGAMAELASLCRRARATAA